MNKELTEPQKKWVAALRSGEYSQVEGVLKTPNGHCCLGVACELAAQEGIILPSMAYKGEGGDDCLSGELEEVRLWLGLNDALGRMNSPWSLADLNDDGKTFAEIADIIESKPDGLFTI
jgi:hypothetical protein